MCFPPGRKYFTHTHMPCFFDFCDGCMDNMRTAFIPQPSHPKHYSLILKKHYFPHFFLYHKALSCWKPSPPSLLFFLSSLLLVFCCDLVKSQLATVSRSLAALTMASGIMLNTAAPLLSKSTCINDGLCRTRERNGGYSMKMSMQLHKHISKPPPLSAHPSFKSPFLSPPPPKKDTSFK